MFGDGRDKAGLLYLVYPTYPGILSQIRFLILDPGWENPQRTSQPGRGSALHDS